MSSSSDYIHFQEIHGGNDPSEATSKRTGPTLLRFGRGLKRSLRQATAAARHLTGEDTNKEEERGENEEKDSSPEQKRVRPFPEGVESPESSSMGRPSGSPSKEMPSVEEEEEEEKVPEFPSDLGSSILRTSTIDRLLKNAMSSLSL
ncbi:UNVERIFIED_CONTAM: hypothetical protein Sindi_0052300 [Sesamum indicum]